MSDGGARVRAMLDAWRAQNADRLHPLQFHFIEALERRAASQDGEARCVLDARLSTLIDAYAADLELAASNASDADNAITPCASTRGALGELLDHLASHAALRSGPLTASDEATQPSTLPTLEALGEFRKIWSEIRAESQVRQSLEQVPANAGPLNSGSLVHRSITLMSELSPGYLQQFLCYVDALSGMEQITRGRASPSNAGPGAMSGKKRARGKPRAS